MLPILATMASTLVMSGSAGAVTVGTTDILPDPGTTAAGTAQAYRFTAPGVGRIDRLNIYLDARSTADKLKLALYSGSASAVTERRAECMISRPKPGAWNHCPVKSYHVKRPGHYWLAVLQPLRASGVIRYREGHAAGAMSTVRSKSSRLVGLPADWKNGRSSARPRVSLYADLARRSSTLPPTTPPTSPSTAVFPDAASTGVPAGTSLTAYAGPAVISTKNTVVEAKTIGCIRVMAPGVVIRKSTISCDGGYAVMSADGDYSGAPLLIEDSEIDCKNTSGTALGEANIIVRRVDISGCENGGDMNQSFTVEDSYIHDLFNSPAAHTDGLQFASKHLEAGRSVAGSVNITIRHNAIFGMGADGSFGTSAIISNRGGDRNVVIEKNLLAGGAFTLYCEQGAKGNNYRVVDNAFSRRFGQNVGAYGPTTDCGDEEQWGNYLYETGQPLGAK